MNSKSSGCRLHFVHIDNYKNWILHTGTTRAGRCAAKRSGDAQMYSGRQKWSSLTTRGRIDRFGTRFVLGLMLGLQTAGHRSLASPYQSSAAAVVNPVSVINNLSGRHEGAINFTAAALIRFCRLAAQHHSRTTLDCNLHSSRIIDGNQILFVSKYLSSIDPITFKLWRR